MNRDKMRKARRLAYEAETHRLKKVAPTREVHVRAARIGDYGMAVTTRTGLYSGQQGPTISVSDLELAEALDDPRAFGLVAAKVGLLVMSALMRTNAHAPDVLHTTAEAAAKWIGINIEELRAQLAEEKATQEQMAANAESKVPVTFHVPTDEHPAETPLAADQETP